MFLHLWNMSACLVVLGFPCTVGKLGFLQCHCSLEVVVTAASLCFRAQHRHCAMRTRRRGTWSCAERGAGEHREGSALHSAAAGLFLGLKSLPWTHQGLARGLWAGFPVSWYFHSSPDLLLLEDEIPSLTIPETCASNDSPEAELLAWVSC